MSFSLIATAVLLLAVGVVVYYELIRPKLVEDARTEQETGEHRPQAVIQRALERAKEGQMAIAVCIIALFAILLFWAMFPQLSRWYVAHGGPVALLIAAIVLGCIVYLAIPSEKIRNVVVGSVGILMALAVLYHFVLAAVCKDDVTCSGWFATKTTQLPAPAAGTPSGGAPAPSRTTPQAPPAQTPMPSTVTASPYSAICPGDPVVHNVGNDPVEINPGWKCSPIIWHKGYCIRVWVRNNQDPERRVVCHSTDPVTGRDRMDPLPNDVSKISIAGRPGLITVQLVPKCYKEGTGGLIPGCVH